MSEIVLRRDANPHQDRARIYRVRLDGREVASIAAGEEKRFAVETGAHTLQLRIDWCRHFMQRSTVPLADSTTDGLPPPSSRRYVNVVLVLLLGVAIVGVVAWLLLLGQRSLTDRGAHLPQLALVLVWGGAFGGAFGVAGWLCKRAIPNLDSK